MPDPDSNYLKKELYDLVKRDEHIFEFLQEFTLDGLWYWDVENPAEEWMNPRFWDILGYDSDKMPHKSAAWHDIIHPEDLKDACENFAQHCENPDLPYDQIVRYTHKNGTTVWIRCFGMAIRDENGKPIRMLGAHRDITALKKKEEDLSASKSRLRQLSAVVANCDNIIVIKDPDLRVTACNQAFAEAAGHASTDTMIGKTDAEIFGVSPETEPIRTYMEDELAAQKLPPGQYLMREETVPLPDGQVKTVLTKKYPIHDANGLLIGTENISIDISQRKRDQERLNTFACIAESETTMVLVTDAQRKLEWASQSFWKLTGYEKDEVIGQNPGDFLQGPNTDVNLRSLMREALDAEEDFQCEILNYTKDGTPYWIGMDIQSVHNDRGVLTHFVAVQQNVTERKKAEQDLLQSNRELEEATKRANKLAAQAEAANQAKSQFLANMSHEIRTPMNGVIGMLHLLLSAKLDVREHDFAKMALTSAQSLMGIIEDILDFSKIEAGKLRLQATEFNPVKLVDELVEPLALRAKDKNLKLDSELDSSIPGQLRGDPVRLRQILNNLLSNALKFTEKGEVALFVRQIGEKKTAFEQNGPSDSRVALEFTVEDTGIGIPEGKIEGLFERFEQIDGSNTRRFGGTGLGLAITKQLLDLMGGTIEVESTLGQGSIFRFTLSFDVVAPADGKDERADLTPKLPAGRILLVEDDHINQLVVKLQLELLGLEVDVVEDGVTALQSCKTSTYDLIIMDLHMPLLDGYETTLRIRQEERGGRSKTPIIALTADAMPSDREACLAAGMNDYLSKPVDPEKLIGTIRKWLDP